MNEVDSMCKNVEYLVEELQAVRDTQINQSRVSNYVQLVKISELLL